MVFTVEIIKEGYSRLDTISNCMIANSTATLILGEDLVVLVDTLSAWDKDYLEKEFQNRGLVCDDVSHVICTHGHSDHVGNLNLFLQATHIVGQCVSHKDRYSLHPFRENVPYKIGEYIEVIATPGHTLSDVSVVVKKTNLGIIVIAGDLFEREEDIANPTLWKETAGSEEPNLQYKNRERVLNMADYIVPGHGPMFKVTDELRKLHSMSC